MKLPDAGGFIVAAQKLLANHDVVYIHDSEGAPVVVLMPWDTYCTKVSWEELDDGMPNHDHIEPEMGEDVPWDPA